MLFRSADIEDLFQQHIESRQVVEWNERDRAVSAREERRLYKLPLQERTLARPDPELVTQAVIIGIRPIGLSALPWTDGLASWRARIALMRRLEPDVGWPDLSDNALLDTLETWLAPFLSGISRANDFQRIDLHAALNALLEWQMKKRLDDQAPTHVTVPSGSTIAIDYTADEPVLAVQIGRAHV